MAVDLELARQQCRVTHNREDALIGIYLSAARAWIENYTGVLWADFEETPGDLDAAVLLLVADMYANREASSAAPATAAAVQALCFPYRSVLA
jgi:uncharacterized phage protein (predicted DNA packaging)